MSYVNATTSEQRQGQVCGFVTSTGRTEVVLTVKYQQGETYTHTRNCTCGYTSVWETPTWNRKLRPAAQSAAVSSAGEVDERSAVSLAFRMNRSHWLAAATGCSSCTGSEHSAVCLSKFTANSPHRVRTLLCRLPSAHPQSPVPHRPTAVHDGILPPAEASFHELPGSVGPGPLPCQLAGTAAVQHQRVEQVRWRRMTRCGQSICDWRSDCSCTDP